jgi:uncharacterized linocin/CFP29 family protein
MTNKYLGRDDAPIGSEVWQLLDQTLVRVARSSLSGRRLLQVEGPFGLSLRTIPLPDTGLSESLAVAGAIPLVLIHHSFTLSSRDLAGFERHPTVLNLEPLVGAVKACSQQEDEIIFSGTGTLPGLLTTSGTNSFTLSDWDRVGTAADDLTAAITVLDEAGAHGPYTLALPPSRFNRLFRLYEHGNLSEFGHLGTIVAGGIIKTPALDQAGVLLDAGDQCASVILGQDMTVGYVGPTGTDIEFSVSESLALMARRPASICVLKG